MNFTPPPQVGERSIAMRVPVCLSVRAHISRTIRPNFTVFYACCPWPWLGPPLSAFQYVMYFRFRGWRHFSRGHNTTCRCRSSVTAASCTCL